MDLFESFTETRSQIFRTIGMHTAGEPTRIVIQGFPPLVGPTLLEKRANAKAVHDNLRKILMHEPRGHRDMYGAILVQETELVASGGAHIGVLFCHNEGYSTMCGHATLALGRFLVDTHDTTVFPLREHLNVDLDQLRSDLILHAPCGPIKVSVPIHPLTKSTPSALIKSDPSRPVWFTSVPSFAVATDLSLWIPQEYCWPELLACDLPEVKLDLAFGGAFYAIVSVEALGFPGGLPLDVGLDSGKYAVPALERAARLLKAYISETPELNALLRHPTSPELEFLYGVTIIDPPQPKQGVDSLETPGSDVNLCFFADHQMDRSPTGSCVCARVALALTKKERKLGVPWVYHSLVTKRRGEGAFTGRAVERTIIQWQEGRQSACTAGETWVVKVEGTSYYTDATTFVLEPGDKIGEGFVFSRE